MLGIGCAFMDVADEQRSADAGSVKALWSTHSACVMLPAWWCYILASCWLAALRPGCLVGLVLAAGTHGMVPCASIVMSCVC